MTADLRRGNIVLLLRPLADLICIVQSDEGGEVVKVRFMDQPPNEHVIVKRSDLIKLADEQERSFPRDWLGAINKQREVIFSPKRIAKEKAVKAKKTKALGKKLVESMSEGGIEDIIKVFTMMMEEE